MVFAAAHRTLPSERGKKLEPAAARASSAGKMLKMRHARDERRLLGLEKCARRAHVGKNAARLSIPTRFAVGMRKDGLHGVYFAVDHLEHVHVHVVLINGEASAYARLWITEE
jgi:hypothetical protein